MYANDGTLPFNPCKACEGKGKYVGFSVIENPCKSCRGLGISANSERPGLYTCNLLALIKLYREQHDPRCTVRVVHKRDSPSASRQWRHIKNLAVHHGVSERAPWWFQATHANGTTVQTEDFPLEPVALPYEENLLRMCEGSAQTRAALNKRIERVLARKAPVESLFS